MYIAGTLNDAAYNETLSPLQELLSELLTPGVVAVLISLLAVQLILMVTALVSLLRKNVPFTGEKVLWLLLIILLNIIGPILYFVIGAPRLDEKAARMENGEEQWRAQ